MRPRLLGISGYHGIRVLGRFVGQQRGMDASEDDLLTASPSSSAIAYPRCAVPGSTTNSNQIRVEVQVQRLHTFVLDRQIDV